MKGCLYLKATSILIAFVLAGSMFFIPDKKAEAVVGCAAGVITKYLGKGAISKIVGSVVPVGDKEVQVTSSGQFVAQCILPPIAIAMARTMARNISNSIVNWINNDFKGKPGFANDIKGLVTDTTDEVIGSFIYGSDLQFLCQPFSFKIRLALATKYSQPFQEQIRCSLTDITKNVSSFAQSNGGAGWNHWLEITTQPQNNEYGAYIMAESQLAQNIQNALKIKDDELARGNGFLDFQVCKEWNPEPKIYTSNTASNNAVNNFQGGEFAVQSESTDNLKVGAKLGSVSSLTAGNTNTVAAFRDSSGKALGLEKTCKTWETKTPGALVADQAKTVLGGWASDLSLATDINQVVGALISHFADKMIVGSQGFLGLSSPGGYAKSNLTYSQAAALSGDTSNPENTGLGDANAAATDGIESLFTSSTVSAGNNLGVGAPASMSSSGIGSSAWITDGDTATAASTGEEPSPWIEIDLGQPTAIGEVHVWSPAGKSAAESIGTFAVVASNTANGRDFSSSRMTLSDASPNPAVVAIGKTARYIRVERFDNSYQCDVGNCYHPLEIGEIEVIGTSQPTQEATSNTVATALNISIGPATIEKTVEARSNTTFLTATIPVDASQETAIASIEVRLYVNGNPTAFNSVLGGGTVGLKQSGATRNVLPGGAPGVDFTNVSAGPSSNSSIIISGNALYPSGPNSFKAVVTAKSSSGATLGTATANFVVQ